MRDMRNFFVTGTLQVFYIPAAAHIFADDSSKFVWRKGTFVRTSFPRTRAQKRFFSLLLFLFPVE